MAIGRASKMVHGTHIEPPLVWEAYFGLKDKLILSQVIEGLLVAVSVEIMLI